MVQNEIVRLQRRIGTEPDGFWGPKSIAQCKSYVRSLAPSPCPWPHQKQATLQAFYGTPGNEFNLEKITFPYPTFYAGKAVATTRVNAECSHSLMRVLEDIKNRHGDNLVVMRIASDFAGVYNFRNKRGGSSYSVHAYGAAIDLAVGTNEFKDSWPMKASMPMEIIECFYREGWISAAVEWGYDAQHFQATDLT
jgi:hypothetical protein